MSTGDHALEALRGLCRARQAVDALWMDCRQTSPSAEQVDALVFGVVLELATVHDAVEQLVESSLSGTADLDPQRMNVANWPNGGEDA